MNGDYQVKGSHIVVARDWIDERLREGAFSMQAKLAGASWGEIILPGMWYPVEPLIKVLAWASPKVGRPVQEVAAEIAMGNARKDLTTIYRAFMRLASPVRLLRMTPMLWRNYVKFAEATVVQNDPGYYIGACTELPERFGDWAVGCWLGFLPVAIEMAGGKGVRAKLLDQVSELNGNLRLRVEIKYML